MYGKNIRPLPWNKGLSKYEKTIEQIKQEANEKLVVQTYIEVKNWINQTNIKGNKNVA